MPFVFLTLIKTFFVLALISTTLMEAARADSLTTTVVGVLEPEKPGDSWIFLLSADGRALRVSDEDRARVETLRAAVGQVRFFQIDFTNLGTLDRIDDLVEMTGVQAYGPNDSFPIEPMTMASDAHLGRIDFKFSGHELTPQGIYNYFKSFKLRRGSQCFHRAYYWGHQLWRQTGVLSQKVFMFFTGRYIRRYNYHWWFHVAPFVYNEKGEEVVLDPTFLKKPVSMQEWTNNFLRNDPVCPNVPNYLGHHAQAKDEWCYVVKAPMWYYHPNIVEQSNRSGVKVRKWDPGWLSNARRSR